MRAVKGSMVSSRPISLSKAAAILARFATAETGARPETTAYLRRTSTAFDELVQFHREIKAFQRRTELDATTKEEDDGGGDGSKEEKKRRRKKKKGKAGMEDHELRGEVGSVDGRNSMEDAGNSGEEVRLEREDRRDRKRKKKRRRRREAEEGGKSNLERKEEEVDDERHGTRKKKKKKKKDKGEREEEGVAIGLDAEARDVDSKERRGLDNEIEWRRKKKRKKKKEKRIRKSDKEDIIFPSKTGHS